ncbi:MAG: MFS transporter [Spirochaetes bacterium]|nr:MFS transporter [Spirochaetota bacterium]
MESATASTGRSAATNRDYRLFLAACALVGVGMCVNSSVFNNYLREVFSLDAAKRTFLELPRELPGLLVTFFIGFLAVLGDARIAAIGNLAAAAGMFALGVIPARFGVLMLWTFTLSTGQHVWMPLINSIGMGFSRDGKVGSILGRIQSVNTAAILAGSSGLLVLLRVAKPSYAVLFSIGAAAYLLAAAVLFSMAPAPRAKGAVRFVVRRAYARFYVLSLLVGARKQLFVTFGPWMLVDLFRAPVAAMTAIFLVISGIGVALRPIAGRLTDRFGERAVLSAESLVTAVVCVVYAFAPGLLPAGTAFVVVAACYVIDQSAGDSVGLARAVYVRRIVTEPEDLSPTLSLGVSIDHIMSMLLPALGGAAWLVRGAEGYRWIFLTGAAVAVANWFVTLGISAAPGTPSLQGVANPAPAENEGSQGE